MRNKLQALTLVELMVTVSIFAILTAVSVPLIMQNRSDQAVNSEATLVKEFVLKAKNFAQNPENEKATSYGFEYDTDTPSQINIVRMDMDSPDPQFFGESLRLGQSTVAYFPSIVFKVPSGEFSGDDISITISGIPGTITGRSNNKTITVSSPGVVNVQ